MSHQFSQVPSAKIPRSSFNRSHGYKTTFDSGYLVPIFLDEVLPGDTLNLRANLFGRLATPLKPIMDNMFLETFFFFVPNRLVWENWQKFNGEQENPGDSTDFSIPTCATGTVQAGSIADYYGIPPGVNAALTDISVLPFRSYDLVWNEWFRDQNLQQSAVVDVNDTGQTIAAYNLRRRGKRHDYFTSSLPWPQKGDPVTVGLSGDAPVLGIAIDDPTATAGGPAGATWRTTEGESSSLWNNHWQGEIAAESIQGGAFPYHDIRADLTAATGISINDLRQSFAIQRLLERDARGGTRYIEIIRSHFGVTSPDARLQRPEFLGGGSSMVNINPVAQTAADDIGSEQTPLANLAAFGTVSASGHGFTKSFVEHGHVIGLVNVRADLTYQQGLNRMWSRQTRFDFFWPALSHLGEQAVLSKEIFVDSSEEDEDVWGYQEAFAEYRYKPSLITGKFRSQASDSLDVWHLSQDFADRPVLSAEFIEDNPPIDRIIAVPDEPQFLLDCYFNYRCARPMPLYGVPGLIDHF